MPLVPKSFTVAPSSFLCCDTLTFWGYCDNNLPFLLLVIPNSESFTAWKDSTNLQEFSCLKQVKVLWLSNLSERWCVDKVSGPVLDFLCTNIDIHLKNNKKEDLTVMVLEILYICPLHFYSYAETICKRLIMISTCFSRFICEKHFNFSLESVDFEQYTMCVYRNIKVLCTKMCWILDWILGVSFFRNKTCCASC